MASRDFDGEIKQAEQEAERARLEMQGALTAWLDAATPWLAERWKASVDRIVKANPDKLKALGADGVKSLRTQTEKLIENARLHLQRRLVDERQDSWPHIAQTAVSDTRFRGNIGDGFKPTARSHGEGDQVLPSLVTDPLATILGDIVRIFATHNFTIAEFRQVDTGWTLNRGYSADLWTNEMITTMTRYATAHKLLTTSLSRRDALTKTKQETEATDLWNQP